MKKLKRCDFKPHREFLKIFQMDKKPYYCNLKTEKMKIIFFWKPLLWLAIICYGLFVPASSLPIKPFLNIPHFDKVVHFSLFFVLCLLLIRPFKKLALKAYLLAPFVAISIGALLELGQHYITASRSSDFYDFVANTTGILASLLFYRVFVAGKKWEKLF